MLKMIGYSILYALKVMTYAMLWVIGFTICMAVFTGLTGIHCDAVGDIAYGIFIGICIEKVIAGIKN